MKKLALHQEDVDAVVTWDDYQALGEKYLAAIGNPEGKYWTSVDTAGCDWLWIAMAEYGDDWTVDLTVQQTYSLIPLIRC